MNYIKLMRPKHYIKNSLIFLPLIFSGLFFDKSNILITFQGFLCFCLIASTIYIINDIKDKEKDRKHKTKKNRPIASGKVSIKNAVIQAIILFITTVFIVVFSRMPIISIVLLGIYFIINLGYSLGLKNIALLDIIILVSGFLIRVLFGATLLSIQVSNWLYLTIIAVSFYLGLGKRRNEIEKNGSKSRKVLQYYTREFLDKNMYMFLCMAIIFYSLWTTDNQIVKSNNNLLIWTIPLVIIICMKYGMNIEGDSDGDPVEVIFKDKTIIGLVLLLMVVLFLILYIL